MDIELYLKRINYNQEVKLNIETLKQLQKQHLLHIPFENLDIHRNTTIRLNSNTIYEKIVNRSRGGFCYELNGLFHAFLSQLGFQSTMISARVFDQKKGYGKEFDHLALLVTVEKQSYLVDVGFGEFIFHPLKMELNQIQKDERGNFIIEAYSGEYFRVSKILDKEVIPQYIFTKRKRKYDDFAAMSHYHQHSPESHFTKKRFLGIPTEKGRITLVGNTLKIIKDKQVEERTVSKKEYKELLVKYFKFDKQ